ncbi:MAG: (Fe-S)-binding protein [Fimbriimonadaceae bacterium]|nr:(Fe-S)-binding protein [Fimbriimonadaceae bacterium]
MRVQLFVTCLNDAVFPKVGLATARVLEAVGCRVEFDERQVCCGQMHLNSGDEASGRDLAVRMAEVFAEAEAVVSPSGSCVAMARHFWPKLAGDTGRIAAQKTFELSEFLTHRLAQGLGRGWTPEFAGRVAWHSSCHGRRGLGLLDQPKALLRQVRGLELLEIESEDQCCGFGGTFSVKNPDVSLAMMDDKLDALEATGAEWITGTDSSCLMHLAGGLSRRGSRLKTIHLAEILAGGAD